MEGIENKVVVVTGAGRGLGREHALLLASLGARVVVNDLGSAPDGQGQDSSIAETLAKEIQSAGGEAISNADDVATWDGAERLIKTAIEGFGELHALVNNAGIIRDRLLFNMSEQEWDDVIRVNLRGTFCPTRFAAAYWRERAKAGQPVRAAVVNTSSGSGLHANPGQANYGAAKAGVAAFTQTAANELSRYGVRVNAIAPGARTRLTEMTPGISDIVRPPTDNQQFDPWDPANVSPLVAFLVSDACRFSGYILGAKGGEISVYSGWTVTRTIARDGRWTAEDVQEQLSGCLAELEAERTKSPS